MSVGDRIGSRYTVQAPEIGRGTFSTVVACRDRVTGQNVALKITRSCEKYRVAAMKEVELLTDLNRNDPRRLSPCVWLLAWFEWRRHVCMVFEQLGPNFYDVMKARDFQPLPMWAVRAVGEQLLSAIFFVHSEMRAVHTDVKLENILLVQPSHALRLAKAGAFPDSRPLPLKVCLIDFGSCTYDADRHPEVVTTRHYRAPEVVLKCGWSYPCDMWSVACVLCELYAGELIFPAHDDLGHLMMMERLLGRVPENIIRQSGLSATSNRHLFTRVPRACPRGTDMHRGAAAAGIATSEDKAYTCLRWNVERVDKKSIQRIRSVQPLRRLLESRLRRLVRFNRNRRTVAHSSAAARRSCVCVTAMQSAQTTRQLEGPGNIQCSTCACQPCHRWMSLYGVDGNEAVGWCGRNAEASSSRGPAQHGPRRAFINMVAHAQFQDLCAGMFAYQVSQRFTADVALKHAFFSSG